MVLCFPCFPSSPILQRQLKPKSYRVGNPSSLSLSLPGVGPRLSTNRHNLPDRSNQCVAAWQDGDLMDVWSLPAGVGIPELVVKWVTPEAIQVAPLIVP